MLEAFVITLREGVEAALVVCLLLAYLSKTGRASLGRPVLWGFAAAVAASIGVGAFLAALRLDSENPRVEGTLLLVSALFVVTMIAWMWLHGRGIRRRIEAKVDRIATAPGRGQKLALFLFTFLMVGREGVEMVLFLAASQLSSRAVMSLVGGLAGIALSVVLGVSFLKGSLRIDLRKFLGVTAVMLLVFAVQLLAGALHEFVEARVVRPGDPAKVMAVLGPIVRHSAIFVLAMILLPFALVAWQALRPPPAAPAAAHPAEERKRRAMSRSERAWRIGFSALAVVALLAIGGRYVYASGGTGLSPTAMLEPRDGVVRVPLASLNEGDFGRYGVALSDRIVRFIVWRLADGPRIAFDACLICEDKGYVLQDDRLICLNCDAPIQASTVGLAGGCNPIPLRSSVAGGEVRVKVSDLEAGRSHFAPAPEAECPYCRMKYKVLPGVTTCPMKECQEKAASRVR